MLPKQVLLNSSELKVVIAENQHHSGARLQTSIDSLIIENEFDVADSPFNFDFIPSNDFCGNPEQLKANEDELKIQKELADGMGYNCKVECEECTDNMIKTKLEKEDARIH